MDNMNALHTKYEGEVKYEVFYDSDHVVDMDFENGEERKSFLDELDKGFFGVYGVVKYEVCKCCCLWSEKDSVWGIYADTPEEALKCFMEEFCEVMS
jgi:hypothetical protein